MDSDLKKLFKHGFFCLFIGLNVSIVLAGEFPVFTEWKKLSDVNYYTPDNLWEYINGAADQFIDYGLLSTGAGEFETDGIQFTLDIYDMAAPLNAFGVYATESRGIKDRFPIGSEAAISFPSQALMFKGQFYIKIYAFKGALGLESGKEILEKISDKLPGATTKPAELERLPGIDRIPGSEGFIRIGFLGQSDLTNCLYAEYKDTSGASYKIFMIIPHTGSTSGEAFDALEKGWESREWNNLKIKARKIPYQGMAVVVLHPRGLYGVSGVEDMTVIDNRLAFLVN